MRIFILNHNLKEHGTYFRAWPIAQGLARRGWDVTFATVSPTRLYRTTERNLNGVRALETPRWTWPGIEADDGWGPLGILARLREAGGRPFDWVYTFAHTPNCMMPALRAMRDCEARLAVDWCDDFADGVFPQREALRSAAARSRPVKWAIQRWAEGRESRAERRLPAMAERVTVIGEALRDKARLLGAAESRIRLIHTGADLTRFAPRPSSEARARLKLPPDGVVLAYVANYHPDEAFLFDALEIVFARHPEVRLLCAGPAFTDPRVARAPYSSRIAQLGRIPWERVPDVIAAGDVSLLPLADTPHNRARCPQKFYDYLAAGRPLAACAVGEAGRILAANRDAGRASRPDPQSFADSILELIGLSSEERAEVGRRARALAERDFSHEAAADAADRFLRDSR